MNTKKKTVMVILLAFAMLILVQAAGNVIVNTDIVALETADADMTITLLKYGNVDTLIECPNWNFNTSTCPKWQKSELTLEQNSTHIWFTTTQQGAYAGVLKTAQQYKTAEELNVTLNGKHSGNITTDDGKITITAINENTRVVMNGVRSTADLDIRTGEGVVAVKKTGDLELDNATVTLQKTGEVKAIRYCPDEKFNFDVLTCSNWETTTIPFIDNGDTIEFVVDHFSAYSGLSAVTLGGVNLSKYGVANNQAVNYSGLVGWWRLEQGNGSFWNDSSGNGNFGVYNGSASIKPAYTAEGTVGGAYKFDGNDDRIGFKQDINLVNTEWTINFWARSITNRAMPIGEKTGNSYIAIYYDLDSIYLRNSSAATNYFVTTTLNLNTWDMFTFNGNITDISVYKNGQFIGVAKSAGNSLGSGFIIDAIGDGYNTVDYVWNGTIDEVMVWNRSLSDAEITNLYNRTKNIYTDHDLGASIANSSELPSNTSISYVYDWRLNGNSIAVLNMPFDLNGSIGTNGNWTTIDDYSTFANNGEYNGSEETMPRWNRTGGYDGKGAYEFDGTDDWINVGNLLGGSTSFTISLWEKNPAADDGKLVEKGASRDMYIRDTSGQLTFYIASTSTGTTYYVTQDTTLTDDGEWHNIVAKYGGNNLTMEIWVDGNNEPLTLGSSTGATNNVKNTGTLEIGRAQISGGQHYFAGSIDQVQIYNRSLTAEQIKEMYAYGIGGYNRIVNEETKANETWQVVVTPFDGNTDGIRYLSNPVDILTKLTLNWTAAYNTSGALLNQTTWAVGGQNITFNATVSNDTIYGVNLLTDGDMEAIGTTAWGTSGVLLSKKTSNPHGGSQVLRINGTATAGTNFARQLVVTNGLLYKVTGWARSGNGTTIPKVSVGGNEYDWTGTASTNWQYFDLTESAVGTSGFLLFGTAIPVDSYIEFDDVRVQLVSTHTSSVWVVVWKTVKSAGAILWEGIMSLVNGVYSIVMPTNTSFGHNVNYTIYADDSNMIETSVDGSFFYNYKPELYGVNLSKYGVADNQAVNYSGLVGWWRLEQGNGSFWNDSSGNGNFGTQGTAANQPTYTAEGATGGGYTFDGTDDYISSDTPITDLPFTMCNWLKTDMLTGVHLTSTLIDISEFDYYFGIGISGSNFVLYARNQTVSDTTTTFTPTINTNTWYYLCGVFTNETSRTIYTNGNKNLEDTTNVNIGTGTIDKQLIGILRTVSATGYYNGTIDEVQVFNRTLSAQEITNLYNRTKNIYTDHDLGASVVNATDGDGDNLSYVYDWRQDGTSIAVLNMPFDLNGTGGSNGNWTTVKDYSTYGNNGEYNGTAGTMPYWNATGGYNGKGAYEFNGTGSNHILVADDDSIDFADGQDFTIATWMRVNSPFPLRAGIVAKTIDYNQQGYSFASTGHGSSINFDLDDGTTLVSGSGGTTILKGNWYYVVGTVQWSTDTAKIYVNGIQSGNDIDISSLSGTLANSQPLTVGRYGNSATRLFNGTIDQVQVFNRTLTAEQIKEMYNLGVGKYNTLVSEETVENDNWTAVVTPIDGYVDGASYTSNIAEILQKLTLNWTAAYNTSGVEINTTTWAVGGQNITFNATVLDTDNIVASTVWVVVWQTVKETGVKIWEGIMSLVNNVYSIVFETNTSLGHHVNYTIYANDSNMVETYVNGTFFYNYQPDKPTSTANNTNTTDTTPQILWNEGADSDNDSLTYYLELSEAYNFTIINYTNTSITQINDTVTSPLADGTYYWRILSSDSYQNSSWSDNYTINIDTTAPTITLHAPINNTGTNKNITLNYTSDDFTAISNCTLKLNDAYNTTIYANTTANMSIDKGATLNFYLYNLSAGRYRWNITCTDILNQARTSENRYLSVAPTTSFGGATTDLTAVDMSNITSLTIDQIYSGLINFTQTVDLTNGTDIDSYVNISNNRISIDTTLAPQLNRAATLTFYNLTFSNPRPVKDGTACPTTTCTEISYDSTTETYQFSVTGFSTYSAEETPVVTVTTTGAGGGTSEGSGGYGGSGPGDTERFTTDKSKITAKLTLKEAKEDELTITNTGTITQKITVKPKNLDGKLTITETEFTLEKGESKKITLYFISGKIPGITFGTLEISTKAQTLEIPIAIEIETDEVLFDAAIDILPLKKTISAGEGLPAQITLFSVGSPRKVDVLLNYIIKDSNGNTISEESETMAVEGQKSFMKEFFIPSDAQTGNYIITLEVIYATTVATASQMFSLIPPPPGKITAATKNTQILSILALALILSTIGTAIILKGRKHRFYNN